MPTSKKFLDPNNPGDFMAILDELEERGMDLDGNASRVAGAAARAGCSSLEEMHAFWTSRNDPAGDLLQLRNVGTITAQAFHDAVLAWQHQEQDCRFYLPGDEPTLRMLHDIAAHIDGQPLSHVLPTSVDEAVGGIFLPMTSVIQLREAARTLFEERYAPNPADDPLSAMERHARDAFCEDLINRIDVATGDINEQKGFAFYIPDLSAKRCLSVATGPPRGVLEHLVMAIEEHAEWEEGVEGPSPSLLVRSFLNTRYYWLEPDRLEPGRWASVLRSATVRFLQEMTETLEVVPGPRAGQHADLFLRTALSPCACSGILDARHMDATYRDSAPFQYLMEPEAWKLGSMMLALQTLPISDEVSSFYLWNRQAQRQVKDFADNPWEGMRRGSATALRHLTLATEFMTGHSLSAWPEDVRTDMIRAHVLWAAFIGWFDENLCNGSVREQLAHHHEGLAHFFRGYLFNEDDDGARHLDTEMVEADELTEVIARWPDRWTTVAPLTGSYAPLQ